MGERKKKEVAVTKELALIPDTNLAIRNAISNDPEVRLAAKETFKFEKPKIGIMEQRKLNRHHLSQMEKYSADFEVLLKEMEDEAAEYIVRKGQEILLLVSTDEASFVPKNIKEAAVRRFMLSVERHLQYQFAGALADHLELGDEILN